MSEGSSAAIAMVSQTEALNAANPRPCSRERCPHRIHNSALTELPDAFPRKVREYELPEAFSTASARLWWRVSPIVCPDNSGASELAVRETPGQAMKSSQRDSLTGFVFPLRRYPTAATTAWARNAWPVDDEVCARMHFSPEILS